MNGPDWASTVRHGMTGGFYDHVAPPQIDALGYGFRVLFMLISAYAYANNNPVIRMSVMIN